MKRVLPLLIIILALSALYYRNLWLPHAPGSNAYLGVVEARMTLVGPLVPGRINQMNAKKGAHVQSGEVLFQQDDAAARAAVAQAAAVLATAEASLEDLKAGKRVEELNVFDQQIAEAKANMDLAKSNYSRTSSLNTQGLTPATQFEIAKAAAAVAQARIDQIAAQKKVAELPKRASELAVAQARIVEAQAGLDEAKAHLADKVVYAPADGRVDDVFFNAGEVADAGQPVISLFTDDALVLRFFVPETARAKLAPGSDISFRCDGCAPRLTAKVMHIFSAPEFTPPVIYSENARGKLVYQVEAKINGEHPALQPGLPIQVDALP